MLKNISNLGTVLNSKEQQQVKGGVEGSQPWEQCKEDDSPRCRCGSVSGWVIVSNPHCEEHGDGGDPRYPKPC